MAFYVKLVKSDEEYDLSDNFVFYKYKFSYAYEKFTSASGKTRFRSKEVCGKIKIDKNNGDVHIVKLAEGDNGSYAKRASWALINAWKNGELPDETYWAS